MLHFPKAELNNNNRDSPPANEYSAANAAETCSKCIQKTTFGQANNISTEFWKFIVLQVHLKQLLSCWLIKIP